MKSVSIDLLKLLEEVKEEFVSTKCVCRDTIARYEKFGDVFFSIMNRNEKEIYDYFWNFIVDDRPFDELGKALSMDFDRAVKILSSE